MQQMTTEKHLKRTWLVACDLFDQVIWPVLKTQPFLCNLDWIGLDMASLKPGSTSVRPKLQMIEN